MGLKMSYYLIAIIEIFVTLLFILWSIIIVFV